MIKWWLSPCLSNGDIIVNMIAAVMVLNLIIAAMTALKEWLEKSIEGDK